MTPKLKNKQTTLNKQALLSAWHLCELNGIFRSIVKTLLSDGNYFGYCRATKQPVQVLYVLSNVNILTQ